MQDSENHAQRILASVLSLDREDRARYLDRVCSDAPELRLRVEQLLAEDERAGSILLHPLPPAHRAVTIAPGDPSGRAGAESVEENENGSNSLNTPQFKPGDMVYERFEVVRHIARGGMGEVYEVKDLQLRGARVAMKTIRSHYAADPLMHERFKREVLMAREISHPHACPIYDLFVWNRPDGQLLFLTMKLLEGETLAARLTRCGPLPLAEITVITRQVGSGLASAHSAGVLHRDIKAANIMLSGAGSEVFACITDFGLARAIDQDSTAFTAQGVPGTPGYVAPELYFGDPPSQASDVFAFGVVVYQMFTGSLPRSAVRDAKALGEVQVPGAPAPWRRMIASCLQPTPAARCKDIPSALRMVPGLADESLTRFVPVAAPSRSPLLSRRRLLALAGAAAAASGAGAWVEWDRIRLLFEPIPEQRFVALLAWPKVQATPVLSTVLDLLSQKLSRLEMTVKNFMLITPQDLPSEASPIDSPATSLQGLGANLVLAAAMEQTASEGRLNLSLLDAHTEKTLRKGSLSCPLAELGGIPQKAFGLAAMLLQLPAHDEKVSDEDQLKRVAPPVLQLYSEAQDLEDLPNSAGLKDAIAKYQKALELSPGFALANARLAIAYVRQFRLTHETANLDLAKRNADIAMSRNPESGTALFSRALVLLYTGKTAEAMTSFEQAQKADPGNPRIMVEKAEALLNTGRLKEAEQVYRDIIAQRPNFWPAYNNLGTALSRQARYQEAADAFDQAGMAAPAVALPMANLGTTYLQMGKNQDARNAMTESIRRAPNADAYLTLGDLDFEAKLYQSALNDYRHAAEIEPNYHLIHRNIGDCYAMLGDTSKEFESYQRAAEVLRKSLSANPQNGLDWANLAYYDAKIHNTQEAEKDIRNAETNGGTDVDSRFMLTQALAVLGRNEEALKMLLWCTDNGISTTGVDLALDLKQLRKDRRYLEHIRERGKNPQGGSTA